MKKPSFLMEAMRPSLVESERTHPQTHAQASLEVKRVAIIINLTNKYEWARKGTMKDALWRQGLTGVAFIEGA